MKKLYLVDVSSLFFRAFYAIRPLTSPAGIPVNAVYGFLSMSLKLLREEKPDYIAFCFDLPTPSFRKEIDPNYKANRSEMPEDLVPQMPYMKRIGEVLGIHCIDKLGFEADDLIGTLATFGATHNLQTFIVSGDKDFSQIVGDNIFLMDTMKDVKMGPKEVVEKWGVSPEQFKDYLAIVGDTSDNIPGVRGIGEVGAKKLLGTYGSLDNIYKNIEEIKGATKDKLISGKETAYRAKELVTIVCNVPLSTELKEYELAPVKVAEIEALLEELNFKALRKNLENLPNWGSGSHSGSPSGSKDTSLKALPNHAPTFEKPKVSALPSDLKIVECSAAEFKPGKALWIFNLSSGLYFADKTQGLITKALGDTQDWKQILDQKSPGLWGFDLKKIFHLLKLETPKADWDSCLAAYALQPGDGTKRDQVISRWLKEPLVDEMSVAEFVEQEFRLYQVLESELKKGQFEKIYRELDLPLAPILYQMERRGFAIDVDRLLEQGTSLLKEIQAAEKEIIQLAGTEFNIGSPKQLAQILFTTLKLPPSKKTKTGFSTDNDVLEKLKGSHPIIEPILQYRELSKLKSTYVDSLPQLVQADGRVHTTLNQAATATGRLSSVDPNMQNIPIRTEKGARVRKAFVAEKGSLLMSVDYSQIELRILAHYSEDPAMIQAFRDDLDIHAATASEIFSTPLKQVTGEQRRAAKAVNFGIAYGQGAFGLAENLGVPRAEAQDIINRYFKRFPGVATYISTMVEKAKEQGFVETLMGRRRYMHELQSANAMIRKFGERAAINAPIQGTAADIVKKAMIDVFRLAKSKMILQVHDELLFEGTKELLESEKPLIVATMESAMTLKVPLKVNAALGPNWDEAH